MSEEDLTNYKTYISDLDITKYIVLDNESNYWYSAEYVDKMFKKQDKETERLNNIINELEKWLRSEIKRIEELQNPAKSKVKPYGEEYNNYTLIIGAYDNVLDKLQELKGEDKE